MLVCSEFARRTMVQCVPKMWRALCVVLVVLSQEVGGKRSRAPDTTGTAVPYVLSLSGTRPSTIPGTTKRRTAWVDLLPWRAQRRRGRRKAAAVETGRSTAAMPHANTAAAASKGVASFIGAFLLGGGTLFVSPQVAEASPFDPRLPPKSSRQPFFEGWFIR